MATMQKTKEALKGSMNKKSNVEPDASTVQAVVKAQISYSEPTDIKPPRWNHWYQRKLARPGMCQ